MSAADIARRLGGATRHGRGWLARCPIPGHGQGRGDRTPSLSLADGDNGRLLVRCFSGCDSRDVLAALRGRGMDGVRNDWQPRPVRPAAGADADGKRQFARKLWDVARPAAGTTVDAYLRRRGITMAVPPALRFHPSLKRTRAAPAGRRW